MANPPFNVKKVDKKKDYVKNDSDYHLVFQKDNANYLWIQYFHSYLNNKGKSGFVMTASASDSAKSEANIRKK